MTLNEQIHMNMAWHEYISAFCICIFNTFSTNILIPYLSTTTPDLAPTYHRAPTGWQTKSKPRDVLSYHVCYLPYIISRYLLALVCL